MSREKFTFSPISKTFINIYTCHLQATVSNSRDSELEMDR